MKKPAVIVVSSHVVRGTVGNRAAVFVLEALGFPVWAVPTVTLPWHPGHGAATRIVPPDDAFAAMLGDLERAPWLGEVGGILTGYLGSAGQAGPVARLVRAAKARNPQALHVCDPVIGDRSGLYVPEATAEAIRRDLLPLADIATPNRYELDWLTRSASDGIARLAEAARGAGPPTVVVTSAPAGGGRIGNMQVEAGGAWLAAHAVIDRPPNGPGDSTAALILAHRLAGLAPREALARATASVYDCLARAVERGSDELMLETDVDLLRHPSTQIVAEPIGR